MSVKYSYEDLLKPMKKLSNDDSYISKYDSITTEINSMFSSTNKVDENEYDDKEYMYKPSFNTDKLIVNNIGKKEVIESLQEYHIIIDSNDRDIRRYPNPFSYVVFFNDFVNSGNANIQKNFQNVKSIRLDTGILPSRYYYTKKTVTLQDSDIDSILTLTIPNSSITLTIGDFVLVKRNNTYVEIAKSTEYPNLVSTMYEVNINNRTVNLYELKNYSLHCNKYHLLYIDEFSYANEYATNNAVSKSFSILFPDNIRSHNVFYVTSRFKDKEFRNQNLSHINRFTINIADANGNILKNSSEDYMDYDVNLSKECICWTNTDGYFVRNYICPCTYFRHPYYHHFQNTLIFKVTQYEKDIDREIFN